MTSFMKIWVLAICICACVAVGCGKKEAPRLPEKAGGFLASPENLGVTLSDNQVTLTWTHAKADRPDAVAAQGFEISKAVPAGCEGCPFVFKVVGVTPMPDTGFTTRLGTDQRAYFRVQAVGAHDIRSEFSKSVLVEAE